MCSVDVFYYRRTALTFMAASLFLETLKVFGELDQQIVEKIRYAKWKATDISRALKEGRVPAAGPPSGGEEDAGDDANNDGQGTEAGGAADLLPTVPQTQPQAPAKPPVASVFFIRVAVIY
jgi:vacuolar protein sorting-associated protein VTA1